VLKSVQQEMLKIENAKNNIAINSLTINSSSAIGDLSNNG